MLRARFSVRRAACGAPLLLIAALLLAAAPGAHAEEEPLIEGVEAFTVYPYRGLDAPQGERYKASIPFRANVTGPLEAELAEQESGTVVRLLKWEINPAFAATVEPAQEGDALTRTSSRDLVFTRAPIGGPYVLRFRHGGRTAEFRDLLVGEIWICAGADNAIGAPGRAPEAAPGVHFFRDGRWGPSEGPFLGAADDGSTAVSAWRRAALALNRYRGIPVGLIGYARRGASIDAFWDAEAGESPPLKDLLERHAQGAVVFFWWQGMQDATPRGAESYGAKFRGLVEAVRRYAGNAEMTVAAVQPGVWREDDPRPSPFIGTVRDAMRRFADEDSNALVFPAMAYPLYAPGRVDRQGMTDLGGAIAKNLIFSRERRETTRLDPQVVSARFADSSRRRVVVTLNEPRILAVETDSHKDWLVTDASSLGFVWTEPVSVDAKTIRLRIHGALAAAASVEDGGETVSIALDAGGWNEALKAVEYDKTKIMIDLARPARGEARLHYAILTNSRGSVRNGAGYYLPATADIPIEDAPGG